MKKLIFFSLLFSFLWICGDAENDGNPQSSDMAFLSTGESVIEIL